ncbi:MAG TPA: phosphatidylserine decarboxylase family protein [Gemmatimonadales bacterium]|nr:phosphatidylserine decarboxylase family protein [Gemmatimonadales bacterium]
MRFAREGYPFIALGALLAIAAVAFAASRGSVLSWLAALLFVILAVWVAYFFRDPERTGERGDSLVVSPADGRIVMITEVDEPAFLKGRALRVSVFMNVFNVHVNRYPVGGTVRYVQYNAGRFFNAAADKASLENEQSSVGIESGRAQVLVRQIAGLVARRIVTYSKVGDVVTQGDRMGLIRFGSRMDVFVPVGSIVKVAIGQNVEAGVTVLAELSAS